MNTGPVQLGLLAHKLFTEGLSSENRLFQKLVNYMFKVKNPLVPDNVSEYIPWSDALPSQ